MDSFNSKGHWWWSFLFMFIWTLVIVGPQKGYTNICLHTLQHTTYSCILIQIKESQTRTVYSIFTSYQYEFKLLYRLFLILLRRISIGKHMDMGMGTSRIQLLCAYWTPYTIEIMNLKFNAEYKFMGVILNSISLTMIQYQIRFSI